MIGDSPCHSVGKIDVISVKGRFVTAAPGEILDILGLGLLSASSIGHFLLGKAFGGAARRRGRARIRSMVVPAAQIPLERGNFGPSSRRRPNDRQRLLPAESKRRHRAASTPPSGTVRILPSAARTVFGVGPGVEGVWSKSWVWNPLPNPRNPGLIARRSNFGKNELAGLSPVTPPSSTPSHLSLPAVTRL